MFEIKKKKILNQSVTLMEIFAPDIALKAKPGQFIILRVDEVGERIPLTIARSNIEEGTITIIFQIVGLTTAKLNLLNEGDKLIDFTGPLGTPSDIENLEYVLIIGGGVGSAICLPLAEALHKRGAKVEVILGFRNKDLVILEEEFKNASDELIIMTDDGSYGKKGFVTNELTKRINRKYDEVITIGPLMMMKNVCKITKENHIKSVVSMNPIMIDGTGMCGGCRLTVAGDVKFACIDGPDFNGDEVDFDEVILRNKAFSHIEKEKRESNCRLMRGLK